MAEKPTESEKALADAIEAVYIEWRKEYGNPDISVVMTNWLVIAEGTGWHSNGEEAEATQIVPGGSTNAMLGLIDSARIRLRAEVVSHLFRPDSEGGL